MQSGVVPISDLNLAISVLLVIMVGAVSAFLKLGLLKSLVWGTFRTFAQLLIMGYALVWIFKIDSPLMVVAIMLMMCYFGARTAVKRSKNVRKFPLGPAYFSLVASTFLITLFVTGVVISGERWYTARIVIPIAGMVLGNSMNSIALSIDRLYSEVRANAAEIETLLALGATGWEAVRGKVREALRAGMTPIINSLITVGLVSLPGMMTGQILGGVEPIMAVRYQIVVMLMLAAGNAMGCLLLVMSSYRKIFTGECALKKEFILSTAKENRK